MNSARLYQIREGDLAVLEKAAADLHDCATISPTYSTAATLVAAEQAKEILSNVRWDYGPHQQVHVSPVDDEGDAHD